MGSELTLVLLAAGAGCRFGGAKQTEPVGPHGEWILEYVLFDALRAGFPRAVLVTSPALEAPIRARIEVGAGRWMPVDLAVQEEARGTGHAVLAARELVHGPFAVANADDVYGPGSFAALAEALAFETGAWTLVAFELAKTLSPHGSVSRALLDVDESGRLRSLEEHLEVEDGQGRVSMNLWGFTPDLFEALAARWEEHEEEAERDELRLPTVVRDLLGRGEATVQVVPTRECWLGITWPDDRAWVVDRLAEAVAEGRYPAPLWGRR